MDRTSGSTVPSDYLKDLIALQVSLLETGVGVLAYPLCENVSDVSNIRRKPREEEK